MFVGVKVSELGMEGSVKNEEVFEVVKKMMGWEFQIVLVVFFKIFFDYEDMLVKFKLIIFFLVILIIVYIIFQFVILINEG